MNATLTNTKAGYLEQVRSLLMDLPAEDVEEMIQDLEAHLVELDDAEVEAELGTAADFAREFRISAGLDAPAHHRRLREMRAAMNRLDGRIRRRGQRLGEVVRWESIRPFWIWLRGWLVVGAWAVLYNQEAFRHFPIPSIGYSTLTGLTLVGLATALSVWVDRPPVTRRRRVLTFTYSVVAGIAVLASLLNPLPDPRTQGWSADPFDYVDRLTAPGGRIVENIYAYDLDGNQLDVLLFDQDGLPLLTMPEWTYDDARFTGGPVFYGEGAVRFANDQHGRIVPNLYPLEVLRQDHTGGLQLIPPPAVGFPTIPSGEPDTEGDPASPPRIYEDTTAR